MKEYASEISDTNLKQISFNKRLNIPKICHYQSSVKQISLVNTLLMQSLHLFKNDVPKSRIYNSFFMYKGMIKYTDLVEEKYSIL